MKNAIKVLCFVIAVIIFATAGTYFYFTWDKGEFEYIDGTDRGTVLITGYIGTEKDVVIPTHLRGKKVTAIDEEAFEESDIVSVKIGKNINYIGKSAFKKCASLESVEIAEGVKSIGEMAFFECSKLNSISIPSTVKKIDTAAFYNTNIKHIDFASDEYFVEKDGVVYDKDMKTIYFALSAADLSEYECPKTVNTIYSYAFAGHDELTSFTINEGVKKLDICVFLDCKGLTELRLPSTVVSVASLCISNSGIKKIYIPKTTETFDKEAFYKMEEQLTIVTTKNSKAAKYAEENNIKTEIVDTL